MRRIPEEKRQECIRLRVEQQLATPAIARMVGISNFSVYRILRPYPWIEDRSRDGRRVTRGKRWTEADVAFLRNFYGKATREKILEGLPGREWNAISKMASMLGFHRHPLAVNPPKRPIHPLCVQLRQAREFQGLTRPQIKARTGIHVQCLHTWETGKAQPDFRSLIAWIDGLGLEISLTTKAIERRAA